MQNAWINVSPITVKDNLNVLMVRDAQFLSDRYQKAQDIRKSADQY